MKKTVLVFAAGLLALTGAAMAETAIVVDGRLETPAGNVPVHTEQGLEQDRVDAPLGSTADGANEALDPAGVGVDVQDNRVRPHVDCENPAEVDALDGMPCHGEPALANPHADKLTLGRDGIQLHKWILAVDSSEASSGTLTKVLSFTGDNVPEEQREAIAEANSQVNVAAGAGIDDLTGSGIMCPACSALENPDDFPNPLRHRGGLVEPASKLVLPDNVGEEAYSGDSWDEFFGRDTPGLQSTSAGGSDLSPVEPDGSEAKGGDLSTLAIAAVAVGGLLLAPAALYHRIRSNHALNNKTRQAVYDAVVRTPGIGVNDAARAANCSYSTAAYHLERLVEERLLIATEDGRRARYFKNGGAFSQSEREFVPVLQSKEAMNVLQVIVENPWCYRAEVAQKLGVSGPTVNWHLKRLMKVGVVKEMREGRVSYLYADKKLLGALGENLAGKLPDELSQRLRFENRPATELVEPSLAPEFAGESEIDLTPLPEASS